MALTCGLNRQDETDKITGKTAHPRGSRRSRVDGDTAHLPGQTAHPAWAWLPQHLCICPVRRACEWAFGAVPAGYKVTSRIEVVPEKPIRGSYDGYSGTRVGSIMPLKSNCKFVNQI